MDDILSRLAAIISGPETGQNNVASALTVDENDSEVALLRALKPYLSGARAEKLDEAVRLMGLMKLVPILRNGGERR